MRMEEFGRAPRCICNVLAVLGDAEESMWAAFHAAVELAHTANARLTLVKTCEPGRAYVWVAPFAVGSAYTPPELESPEDAARKLCCVADQVPDSMPVTTLVLTQDTQASLLKLLEQGHFGAVVADRELLSRCRRLRRLLERQRVYTVIVEVPHELQNVGSMPAAIEVLRELGQVKQPAGSGQFATPR